MWTPLVLNSAGIPLHQAVLAGAMIMVGAALGSLAIGPLMDRFNPYTALATAFFVAAIIVLSMMLISGAMPFGMIMAILFVVGFMMAAGGVQGASALAGMYCPTFIRSTGIGWEFGFGRIGAIAGTMLGGALIAAHWSFAATFFMASPPLLIRGLAVVFMRWRVNAAEHGDSRHPWPLRANRPPITLKATRALRSQDAARAASHTMLAMQAVSESQIVALVDAFYAKIRRDEVLAPIFERAIAPESWPVHLAKMYDFWSSVMLTTGRYKGNPLAVHMRLAGIEPAMFGRWLALFRATAEELFPGELAANFRAKSERIAESLKLGLFYRPGLGGLNIAPRSPT